MPCHLSLYLCCLTGLDLPFVISYTIPANRSQLIRLNLQSLCAVFILFEYYSTLDMTVKIALFCDSRGGFLQYFLDTGNVNSNIVYTVFTRKGRKLEELWLQAKSKLLSKEFDHVVLWGGICNITSPYFYQGVRYFWPMKNITDLAYDLIFVMDSIAKEVIHFGLTGRVTLIPETGANLLMYNQVISPQPWMMQCQADLNANVPFLLDACKRVNSRMNGYTPWTFDIVYSRSRTGEFYIRQGKLYDGLHPTPMVARDMSKKIMGSLNLRYPEVE